MKNYTSIKTSPPLTVTGYTGTGSVAGRCFASPVLRLNIDPWQGHCTLSPMILPFDNRQCSWVHTFPIADQVSPRLARRTSLPLIVNPRRGVSSSSVNRPTGTSVTQTTRSAVA